MFEYVLYMCMYEYCRTSVYVRYAIYAHARTHAHTHTRTHAFTSQKRRLHSGMLHASMLLARTCPRHAQNREENKRKGCKGSQIGQQGVLRCDGGSQIGQQI